MQKLSTPGVPNEGKYSCSIEEPGEYKVIEDGTKLEDCGSVEVGMRNGEVGVKHVKNRVVGGPQL